VRAALLFRVGVSGLEDEPAYRLDEFPRALEDHEVPAGNLRDSLSAMPSCSRRALATGTT
jgi:hypothetical protein